MSLSPLPLYFRQLALCCCTLLGNACIIHASDAPRHSQWLNVRDYGAIGDGIADDTLAIESALLAARTKATGTAIFLPAGIYRYSRNIQLAGIAAFGEGMNKTIVEASDCRNSAWVLSGASPAISDLSIRVVGPHSKRDTHDKAVGLMAYRATDFSILRVKLGPIDSAGIMIRESSGSELKAAQVRDCVVSETLADGIHLTAASHHIEVSGNRITNTGDDFIAVVSYRADRALCHDVNIHNNQMQDQSHGRGISVVGGNDVSIAANEIKRSSDSGIYLASESAYDTFGDTNIKIAGNMLSDVVSSHSRGHGGILLLGRPNPASDTEPLEIKNVHIIDNRIDGSTRSGIHLGAYSSNVTITGNEISNTQASGISVYANTCDILIGTEAIDSPPNIIRSCGEHGIQVNPAGSRGKLRISGVKFQGINTKALSHIAVISIGAHGSFDHVYVTDNRFEQPNGMHVAKYIESLSPATTARNAANIDFGSFVQPN